MENIKIVMDKLKNECFGNINKELKPLQDKRSELYKEIHLVNKEIKKVEQDNYNELYKKVWAIAHTIDMEWIYYFPCEKGSGYYIKIEELKEDEDVIMCNRYTKGGELKGRFKLHILNIAKIEKVRKY